MKIVLKVILAGALLISCGQKKEDKSFGPSERLSTNDLTFLMPLNQNDGNRPLQRVQAADINYGILSQTNFNRVLQAARNEQTFLNQNLANPRNWFLVSFRYSPCIHFSGQANACKEHVRFVFQPYQGLSDSQSEFSDYAMHVTYQFREGPSAERTELLETFSALQTLSGDRTRNQPLQVHPVLSDPTLNRPYFSFIKTNIIDRFIRDRAPTAITFLGLGTRQGQVNPGIWKFLFGKTGSNGQWNHMQLPAGTGHSAQTLTVDGTDLSLSVNQGTANSVPFNVFATQNAQIARLNIFDAMATNEHNTDCASCHVSDNQVFRNNNLKDNFANLLGQKLQNSARLTENLVDNRFRGGLTVPNEIVTRIFGYMGSRPIISQRIVADSALAVDMANRTLGTPDVNQCPTAQSKRAVVNCLNQGGQNTSMVQCLLTHCRPSNNPQQVSSQ